MNVLKRDTLKSEIMWCTEIVMWNYSCCSYKKKNDLFASDSKIASQFSIGKAKCSYMILYGILMF